jgi:hypothetical protein
MSTDDVSVGTYRTEFPHKHGLYIARLTGGTRCDERVLNEEERGISILDSVAALRSASALPFMSMGA